MLLRLLVFSLLSISTVAQTQPSQQSQIAGDALPLRDGWTLQSSHKVETKGEIISTPQFTPTGWYAVSVPTTVVAAMVKHKVYPDPMFGMNLRSYPGMNYPIGGNFSDLAMRQDSPFMIPWWYRKTFVLPESYKGKTIW